MATLGADIANIAAGRVVITLPIEQRLSQQNAAVDARSLGTFPNPRTPGGVDAWRDRGVRR